MKKASRSKIASFLARVLRAARHSRATERTMIARCSRSKTKATITRCSRGTTRRTLLQVRSASAETLAEVMIALVVLAVGVGGAVTMVYTSISANAEGKDRIIAYNLAREGVEAIRNVRDTNWLRFPGNRSDCWDVTLDTTSSLNCIPATGAEKIGGSASSGGIDYIVYPDLDETASPVSLFSWILDDIDPTIDDILLYEVTVGSGIMYTHDSLGTATKFSRVVNITKESSSDPMIVTATVTWEFKGRERSVIFMDELTNY